MSAEKKAEKEPIRITPPLMVEFAWLDKPRPPFEKSPDKEPKFSLAASGDADDDAIKELIALIEGDGRPRGVPYSTDRETGRVVFKFSSKYPVEIYDSKGTKTEGVFPGRGSVVRVGFVRNTYPGFGGGVNLYLNGVQILEFVPFRAHGSVSFGPVEGGWTKPEETAAGEEAGAEARSESSPF